MLGGVVHYVEPLLWGLQLDGTYYTSHRASYVSSNV